MQFGKAIGIACSSFAITNIDDMFVLITFFAEAATSKSMTPPKIAIGQYIGFTVIVLISLIGFAISLVVTPEPIGFLGLLPILLGVWKGLSLLVPLPEDEDESEQIASVKSVLKVAAVTIMNGGDNIGTYIPLFAQANGAEVGVYVVVYYILLGVWCGVAYLLMGQGRFLRMVQKYVHWFIPFLYLGLGTFIVVKSECYPWSIEKIDEAVATHPGKIIMAMVTIVIIAAGVGTMMWFRLRKKANQPIIQVDDVAEEDGAPTPPPTAPSFHEGTLSPTSNIHGLRARRSISSHDVDGANGIASLTVPTVIKT